MKEHHGTVALTSALEANSQCKTNAPKSGGRRIESGDPYMVTWLCWDPKDIWSSDRQFVSDCFSNPNSLENDNVYRRFISCLDRHFPGGSPMWFRSIGISH